MYIFIPAIALLLIAAATIIFIYLNRDEIDKKDTNNNEFNKENITNNENKNYSGTIVILLIIIIILILNYNGFFYKFKIITEENINEIISTDKLSTEQKQIIHYKYIFNKQNVVNKNIYQVLK